MRDMSEYQTIVFDCDGVLLDSNKVKTQAFYLATLDYGEDNARAMVDYHVNNGGISRFEKFRYFLREIAGVENYDEEQTLLAKYAALVEEGLLTCQVADNLPIYRESFDGNWLIASGGAQSELRDIFAKRNMSQYFDGGIYGSPDDKQVILKREIECGNIKFPALFIGDSKYDFISAQGAGLDFVFLNCWTEVKDWEQFCELNDITAITSLKELFL